VNETKQMVNSDLVFLVRKHTILLHSNQ